MSYCFYDYTDVEQFVRTYPKRCSNKTTGGIACEYYTVPRTHTDHPKGYTAYIYRYDLNRDGVLTRIGIRLPKYVDENGMIVVEEFDIIEGKFGAAALEKLNADYINTDLTYAQFKAMYPLGPYATRDAYWTLRQYYPQGVPRYPSFLRNLWMIQMEYKKDIITFCIHCSRNDTQALMDVLITPEDYASFADYAKHKQHTGLNICMNSNLELYQLLKNTFPNARFYYDAYQLSFAIDRVAKTLPATDRKELYEMKAGIRKNLNTVFQRRQSNSDSSLRTYRRYAREFMHKFRYMALPEPAHKERNKFFQRIDKIQDQHYDFLDGYYLQPAFHQSLPQELLTVYQNTIAKPGGFGPERTAYIMLSLMREINAGKNLNHIDIYDNHQIHSMQGIAHTKRFSFHVEQQARNKLTALKELIERI